MRGSFAIFNLRDEKMNLLIYKADNPKQAVIMSSKKSGFWCTLKAAFFARKLIKN